MTDHFFDAKNNKKGIFFLLDWQVVVLVNFPFLVEGIFKRWGLFLGFDGFVSLLKFTLFWGEERYPGVSSNFP